MARLNRTQTIKRITEQLGLTGATDVIPTQVSNLVMPVYSIDTMLSPIEALHTDDIIVRQGQVTASAGTVTLYTVPNIVRKDFYLTSIYMCFSKDVTQSASTGVCVQTYFTVNGVSTGYAIGGITLTAQNTVMEIVFPFPIKVDRGTNITLTHASYGAGNAHTTGTITGYLAETVANDNS